MQKPNWQKMVRFLLDHYKQTELSALTGIDQAQISRIKNGAVYKSPTYDSGIALINAYNDTLKKELLNVEAKSHSIG